MLAKASTIGCAFWTKPAPPPTGGVSVRLYLSFVKSRIFTNSITTSPFPIALLMMELDVKPSNISGNKVKMLIFITFPARLEL